MLSEVIGPLVPCDNHAVYFTVDGRRPRDRPPAIISEMNAGISGVLVALSALGLLSVLALSIYFYQHRYSGLIKASQPPMMILVLLGEIMIALRVLFASFPVGRDVWVCHGNMWFGHLGFCMAYGGLFLKMWRIGTAPDITHCSYLVRL